MDEQTTLTELLCELGIGKTAADGYAEALVAEGFDTPVAFASLTTQELQHDFGFKRGHLRMIATGQEQIQLVARSLTHQQEQPDLELEQPQQPEPPEQSLRASDPEPEPELEQEPEPPEQFLSDAEPELELEQEPEPPESFADFFFARAAEQKKREADRTAQKREKQNPKKRQQQEAAGGAKPQGVSPPHAVILEELEILGPQLGLPERLQLELMQGARASQDTAQEYLGKLRTKLEVMDQQVPDGGRKVVNKGAHFAAVQQDTAILRQMHADGVDMSATNELGGTPAYGAASQGLCTNLRLLHSWGASIGVCDSGGAPVHAAARSGHATTVRTLHELGADIAVPDRDGDTAAHDAARGGHTECLKMLHELGASLSVTNRIGETPASHAANCGQPAALQMIGRLGGDLTTPDEENGLSPIHTAIANGHAQCVAELHSLGVSIRDLIRSPHDSINGLDPVALATRLPETAHGRTGRHEMVDLLRSLLESAPPQFGVGTHVRIRDLRSGVKYNGLQGTVRAFLAVSGRCRVLLDNGDSINVKPANLDLSSQAKEVTSDAMLSKPQPEPEPDPQPAGKLLDAVAQKKKEANRKKREKAKQKKKRQQHEARGARA
jgi:ankyrin repeat protein